MKTKITILFSIILLLSCGQNPAKTSHAKRAGFTKTLGAITRGDTSLRKLSIVFTGDEYGEGGNHILSVLKKHNIQSSFFLTGNFYRNPKFKDLINYLIAEGHYLGAHSDKHLLYCDWVKRDSLFVTYDQFKIDLENNYKIMSDYGISKKNALYFLPPYEWHNDTIGSWTKSLDLQLINITYGTYSHADYTTHDMPNYKSSEQIFESILSYEQQQNNGLNGFILLIHIGTSEKRKDKFYNHLDSLITNLKTLDYQFERIDNLLNPLNK